MHETRERRRRYRPEVEEVFLMSRMNRRVEEEKEGSNSVFFPLLNLRSSVVVVEE